MINPRGALLALVVVPLLLVGSAIRLAPLKSDQRTMAAISEDGYLMLTVSRNIAQGRSLTIADGTIATNGVQPLVTFLWAAVHAVVGGERLPALRLVLLLQFVIAILTAVLVGCLARHAFERQPWARSAALVAASIWFASPLTLRHTANGLETGPYVCAIAAILLIDHRWAGRSATRSAVFGLMLGALFLVRNDAVFFIAAYLLVECLGFGTRTSAERWRVRAAHAAVTVVGAVVVAAPWLAYNVSVFGHLVPVSGRAQNLNIGVGDSLVAIPRVVAEYAWMLTPLPAILLEAAWPLALALGLVLATALTVRQASRAGVTAPRWMVILLLHAGCLAAYYGLFFGAAYFLSRYLFPLSVISVLVPTFWVVSKAATNATAPAASSIGGVVLATAVTLLVVLAAGRLYSRSHVHPHGQVVEWVETYLTPQTWVGAPQSGTLGYFHDRTINLDGKVNPAALQARQESRLFRYIVDDTQIQYLVDWYGLARWVDRPDRVDEEKDVDLLVRAFRVLVRDPDRNLVVLERIARSGAAPE